MTFYHHGHGAFLCSVGYGHVCGEDEDYEASPGGPGGEGVHPVPPTRPGGVGLSPSPVAAESAGRVTRRARLAAWRSHLGWRLWEWRHREVLRRRFEYVKGGDAAMSRLPEGWSVRLDGLSNVVRFRHEGRNREFYWCDGQWWLVVGSSALTMYGLAEATNRNDARRIGTDYVIAIENDACDCSAGDICTCSYICVCRERNHHVYTDGNGWRNVGPAEAGR